MGNLIIFIIKKVKGKAVLLHAMEALEGRGGHIYNQHYINYKKIFK
jgi:hypothetical protein